MARNASGVMTLAGDFAIPGPPASSSYVNGLIDDIVAEITASLSRDGKGGMRAPLAMGNNKITGLANGAASTDAAAYGQLQTSVANHATSVGGTGDAITAGFTPAISTLTTNLALRVTATAANTITNPVINIDTLGNKTIKKYNGLPLEAGDITGAGHVMVLVYNGTDMILLNPKDPVSAVSDASDTVAGKVELATAAEYQANTPANRALTNTNVWAAAATVALTDAATVAVDMGTGINFTLTINGNRTLGAPTNTKVGQSGFIKINTTTNGQTLGYHADYKFASGTDPVLSTVNTATDILFYEVIAANFIYASLVKAVA